MRACVVTKYKQPLELADLPEPAVEDHDVLVDIHAAAVNLLDAKVQAGEFKAILPYKAPFVLGHDLAGTVIAVGSDVTRFTVGDEVYGRPFDQTPDALTYVQAGRSKGKVLIITGETP